MASFQGAQKNFNLLFIFDFYSSKLFYVDLCKCKTEIGEYALKV